MVVWRERREDDGAARMSSARLSNAGVRHEVAGEKGNDAALSGLKLAGRPANNLNDHQDRRAWKQVSL